MRGFFIVVIIIDHLSRWPSMWSAVTGKALVWVTAAEGFVIISGMLVGYVRGFKNRALPMLDVTKKLLGRALVLYIWAVIGSIIYTVFVWYVPLQGGAPGMPIARGEFGQLILQSVSLQYTYVWVHFLKLYAIFLALSPIAVWLLRTGRAWAVAGLSLIALIIGWMTHSEALQWQFLFFIPAIFGYYLEACMAWWQRLNTRRQTVIAASLISLTLATMVLSALVTFHPEVVQALAQSTAPLFAKDSISLLRAGLAFLWFGGVFFIFRLLQPIIVRWFSWLLESIGNRSLTAYILHGVAIIIISATTVSGSHFIVNSLLGLSAVLLVWVMLKIPGINRVIPS